MRSFFLFLSLAILGLGLYFNWFYDVPDSQAQINFFVSRFLIIIGVGSFMMNIFWSTPKPPSRNQ